MTDTNAAPPLAPAPLVAAPTGPELAGAIGAELAEPVTRMAQALQALRARPGLAGPELAALEEAAAHIRQIAVNSQQVARLGTGRLRQSHEKLALHTILHDVLLEHHARFVARGIIVSQYLRPVEIIVDPGLLVSLLNAAVDWSASQGSQLQVKLRMKNWPENGLLGITASRTVQVTDRSAADDGHDSLLWFLLQHTALAMGVLISSEVDGENITLNLEFPRTVRNLSGLTAMDVDPGKPDGKGKGAGRSFENTFVTSREVKGSSILLVTDDARLQQEVAKVCLALNLRLDTLPTTRKATRFCEQSPPHLIVIDENLRDAEFDQLHADLVRHNTRFPVIEVAPADEALAISDWGDNGTSRIGRHDIARQLPAALALELNKLA